MAIQIIRALLPLDEVQRMAAEQRPARGNRSRGVDDPNQRRRIEDIVRQLIVR